MSMRKRRIGVFGWIGIGLGSFVALVILGNMAFALPAAWSLPSGIRPGLEELTIEDAADRLSKRGLEGLEEIEAARAFVGERMAYCRRNSFDHYSKAFRRGYGYCQQKGLALVKLLRLMGYDARPVQALKSSFPDGNGRHLWVRVTYNGEERDICPDYTDPETGELMFKPITPVTEFPWWFRVFSAWGCIGANAYRYYRTKSDTSGEY